MDWLYELNPVVQALLAITIHNIPEGLIVGFCIMMTLDVALG